MSSPKDNAIDEELFQFYLQFRLRQIQKSMLLWDDNSEKEALVSILTNCQHVNGNTLRMVFGDIFDKSSQTFTFARPTTTALTTATKPVVIPATGGKRKYTTTSQTQSSRLALDQHEPAPLLNDTDTEDEHSTTDSEQEDGGVSSDYSESSNEEITPTKKRRTNPYNTDPSVPLALKHLITKAACTDLEAMIGNVPVTKDIFRSRMNFIKDTFKIYYTPRNGSSPPKCRFEISKRFSYLSPMGQCQLNMIAYQLGKIDEMEKKEYSQKQIKAHRLRYYMDLSKSLEEPKLAFPSHLQEFPRHCERALYVVRNIGAYVLFMPEVLTPTTYKKVQTTSIPVLKTFLESRCTPFESIARFTDKDNKLLVSPSTGELAKFLEEGNPYYSRFMAFSF